MSKTTTIVFFLILLLIGVLSYKDYGISWDEPIQRKFGLAVFNYIFNGSDQMFKSSEKYYGPVFEFILVVVEKVLNLTLEKEIYQIRHLFTFIFNFVGYIFFYKLTQKAFKNRFLSLTAVSFLAFSPLFFAHSFYNSKDAVLMSGVIIASYFSLKFLKDPRAKNALLAGFFCALAITIRIAGIFVPVITLLILIPNFKIAKIKPLLFYILSVIVFTFILWPLLWNNPVKEFTNAFNEMKRFHETSSTVFLGRTITGDKIPWFYIPLWMMITIPYTQVLLFVSGVLTAFKSKIEKTYKLYFILWFFLPLITIIFLKSTLYDGWRQMFFIYPGFILISICGLEYVLDSKVTIVKVFVIALVCVNLAQAVLFINKWHPNQNVFFNFLAGGKANISGKFSLDYWGLVYKQLYDYIADSDEREQIIIYVDTFPGETNLKVSKTPQKFILSESVVNSDYFLTNFRSGVVLEESKKVYKVAVDGVEIGAVYKVN